MTDQSSNPPSPSEATIVVGRGGPRPTSNSELSVGTTIGRYIIIKMIGRGGMGEVYSAYDPDLDRRVALKLLRESRAGAPPAAHAGLLREAKALGRLSHPNVVTVHDVGSFAGRVFIAMELIDGLTLREWLQAERRAWREILRVFVAAGHGLMAAHQAGLVHRDFKPENVMLTRAGQIRVSDFGLARPIDELSATGEPFAADASLLQSTFSHDDLVGTPAYMAPEQFAGQATDARTDQFSFCVALYEALYGERPFAGDTLPALAANVRKGVVRTERRGPAPPAVQRIILRGLEPLPSKRYPSLEPLLRDLDRLASRNRLRVFIWSAVATVAILTMVGATMIARKAPVACADGLERLHGVWDPPIKGQIRRAFEATKELFAGDAYASASRLIDAYAGRWVNTYTEACQATQVRRVQSPEALDLRMACLQDRLGNLKALTAIFVKADSAVVENAVKASSQLGDLDRCSDLKLLRAVMPPPDNPAARREVDELQRRLADARALSTSGRSSEAEKATTLLVADARRIGHAPLLADALELRGSTQIEMGAIADAEKTFEEGVWTAEEGHHDEAKAEMAVHLIYVVSMGIRPQDTERWWHMSQATLRRIGGHERQQVWMNTNLGAAFEVRGQPGEALARLQQALAIAERVLGPDDPDLERVHGNMSNALVALGRPVEALIHSDRAIEIGRKTLGADHPEMAIRFSNRGEILNQLGRFEEARASCLRALALWEKQLGKDHVYLAFALTAIGLSYLGEGKPATAVTPLERALRLRLDREPSPGHIADTEFALARALWDSGQRGDRARALATSAKDRYAKITTMTKREDEVAAWLSKHGPGR